VTGPTPATAPGSYDFNTSWLFGGVYAAGSADPGYDDTGFAQITLPHTVTPLSWGNWDHTGWEKRWIYRKHFRLSAPDGSRVFADFDGVMVNADVVLNGTGVGAHQGGYLPWSAELTRHLRDGDNVLAVIVDARQVPVPPMGGVAGSGLALGGVAGSGLALGGVAGSGLALGGVAGSGLAQPGSGAAAIDFLQPGGIYRGVVLRVVPAVFLSDVFARPVSPLAPSRSVAVQATIDAAAAPGGPVHLTATLLDGSRVLGTAGTSVSLSRTGTTAARLTIAGIGEVDLWSPDSPQMYTTAVTLTNRPGRSHTVRVRTGFREAVFRPDGFYLNGKRLKLFGLNRHQHFPYLGMGAPARLQRKDAEILKRDLNCNMVRCSHYPQSPDFLDACDELGLMVWEEPPGWQHIGDAAWQDIVMQNVRDMIIRDRNRPSVIVWATRLNETAGRADLYAKTRQIAAELDGTRQTTGAMNAYSTRDWAQDVFAYDDYHGSQGNAYLLAPLPGLPYLVSEAVGALSGPPTYRWADPGAVLARQALLHAQVHATARSGDRYAGLLGWAGIDYASLNGGDRIWQNLKTPGVIDTFRVPKPGAAIYRSQISPDIRPVIAPAFFWDFGESSPDGPGPGAMIATNCDRLELYVAGEHVASRTPDTENFGGLAYPPVFADLTVDGTAAPELRIVGYVRGTPVASLRMAADTSADHLVLSVDDDAIQADGTDTTRITFRAADRYGNTRRSVTGSVTLSLDGPAVLVGDNPFDLTNYGPVGGAFIRSVPGRSGIVTIGARHPGLGRARARVTVAPPDPRRAFL
jgi:beta-galactosidase